VTCATCTTTGRRGYCAPFRCYCGHKSCHAFASFVPRIARAFTARPSRKSTAWADREESTWIDKL